MNATEVCPGCGARLPKPETEVTHRYMTSSASCWAVFNALSVDARGLEGSPWRALLVDGFAVHHPGTPSAQSVQSVAIHLMVLHGVLERGFDGSQTMWLRTRPGRFKNPLNHDRRFHWLTPPSLDLGIAVCDVEQAAPIERPAKLEAWLRTVWAAWRSQHGAQIEVWFERYVIAEA